MANKSIINFNRVFLDTGASSITTNLSSAISNGTDSVINVLNTKNFKSKGVIKIGSEEIYYGSKTDTTFTNLTRGANVTTSAGHSNSALITQEFKPINANNNTDEHLGGWYVNCETNNAALRIGSSDIIKTGVIKYDNSTGIMEGCYSIDGTNSQPHWNSINNIHSFTSNVEVLKGIAPGDYSDVSLSSQFDSYGTVKVLTASDTITKGSIIRTELDPSTRVLKAETCLILIKINNGGGHSSGSAVTLNIDASKINLNSGKKIYFRGGGIFTLTSVLSKDATTITGNLSANVSDNEIGYAHLHFDIGNLGIALETKNTNEKIKILTNGVGVMKIENSNVGGVTGGFPITINPNGFGDALQYKDTSSNVLVLGNLLYTPSTPITSHYHLVNFNPDYSKLSTFDG